MVFTADNMPWGCYLVFLGFVFSVSLEDKCIFQQKINGIFRNQDENGMTLEKSNINLLTIIYIK